MNYRDAELLNSSIDKVGESILRSRMLDQQQENTTAAQGLQQQQVDVNQQKVNNEATAVTAKTAAAQAANTQRVWEDTTKMFGGWVKDGIVDPAVAQEKLQAAYDQMPDTAKAAVANHPAVQAMLNGDSIWQKPEKPAKDAKEVDIAGRRFAQTAGGALVPLDKEPSRPFARTTGEDGNRVTQHMTADEYKLDEAMREQSAAQKAVDSFKPAPEHFYNSAATDNGANLKHLQDALAAASANVQQLQGGGNAAAPAAAAPAAAAPAKKQLDAATATELLQEAGGDKNKARQLAIQRGYVF